MKRTRVGFLDSLRDSYNTSGSQIIPVDLGNGQEREVKLRYLQRTIDSEVLDTPTTACPDGEEKGYIEDAFSIAMYARREGKFSESYISRLCEGAAAFSAEVLQADFDAMAVKINKALLTQQAASFGVNIASGASTVRTVQILNGASDDALLTGAMVGFLNEEIIDLNQFHNNPIIVGQGVFGKANALSGYVCCNDNGFDPTRLPQGYMYFKDLTMADGLGDIDECVVYEPGSLKFLTFHKYRNVAGGHDLFTKQGAYGAYRTGDGSSKGLVVDPVTGLIYDFFLKWNDCEDSWDYRLELNFDLAGLPSDMYQTGDPLAGSNGTLLYKFTRA